MEYTGCICVHTCVGDSGAYFNTLFHVRRQLDTLSLAVAGARVLGCLYMYMRINCIMLTYMYYAFMSGQWNTRVSVASAGGISKLISVAIIQCIYERANCSVVTMTTHLI